MGCSTRIACYPAKIPHFFENLKILAFYAILLRTPLIACESFMEALLSGFQGVVCRLARPSNRWLKRPRPNASRRCPPFKSSTPESFRGSCSYGLFPWVTLLRFAFGQKIWHTIFLSSKANFKIFPKLLPKPRRASPSLKNSPAMVLPSCPAPHHR
jgi:hypothetical protein